ncbi:hypothetical protein LWC34_50785 [Kibdelosporangium philippinense]|uniref:Lipoprotein n=1 Tax=Kibdelosporangium philippinense TaxID=211113 RepID=A0ABS8ZTJ9_9PSEU|nr:hypothetical protein [Kibdelosporangium philippinense]MCE7011039.1 hypothetical protein [Kibdelosporangium philippinense]
MRVVVPLLSVIVLAGCAAQTQNQAAPGPASTPQVQQQQQSKEDQEKARLENLIADCMKAQGFEYIARPRSADNTAEVQEKNVGGRDPSMVPYETLKTYRQKYGFGVYSRDVFPTDPAVGNSPPPPPDPNQAIRDKLDPAQRDAYDKALGGGLLTAENGKKFRGEDGCTTKAAMQVYPPQTQAPPDPAKQAEFKQLLQRFQTDPQLLNASQAYGTCLRQAGFQVASTKPGVIESTMQQTFLKERSEKPDTIDANTAQQGLQREIQAALKDLDCGKEYERLAKPLVEKMLSSDGGNG